MKDVHAGDQGMQGQREVAQEKEGEQGEVGAVGVTRAHVRNANVPSQDEDARDEKAEAHPAGEKKARHD